jgi:hypothetical protein
MKPKASNKPSWPPILQHQGANGQTVYQIAVMIDGKRIRERFKSLEAAEERAKLIRDQYREEGKSAFTMPVDLRLEATRCAKKRSRRVVEINDTLAAWLAMCAKPAGKVVPLYNLTRSMHKLPPYTPCGGLCPCSGAL